MPSYDFSSLLSPLDFEALTKDLLEAETGLSFECFMDGPDGGVDLRHAPISEQDITIIVQCKRLKPGHFSQLKSGLKTKELPKIRQLNPGRYILVTSVSLSPGRKKELQEILDPFICTPGDIYGQHELNALLGKYPEVEKAHIKLWLQSSGVLDAMLHSRGRSISEHEIEQTKYSARLYVKNESFNEALELLENHRVCIISGIPGIGKTTLARILLLHFLNEEYKLIWIESNINEAPKIPSRGNKICYIYDDFLGKNASSEKLAKGEDSALVRHMRAVNRSTNAVMILTTRDYLLEQAKYHYENLNRADFDHRLCVLDLSKYTRRIKSQILYNHLFFSEIPAEFIKVFVREKAYQAVVDHQNYSPRLIEYMTISETWSSIAPEDFPTIFRECLENPTEIWDHAYRRQIDSPARAILIILATLPSVVSCSDLENAFETFRRAQALVLNRSRRENEFQDSLRILEGNFIAIDQGVTTSDPAIRFQNPSIRDFIWNHFPTSPHIKAILETSPFFEQVYWFMKIQKDETAMFNKEPLVDLNYDSVRRLMILVESPALKVAQKNQHRSDYARYQETLPGRLASIASINQELEIDEANNFISNRIPDLIKKIKANKFKSYFLIDSVFRFDESRLLSEENRSALLEALKVRTIGQAYYANEYEEVVRLLDRFPQIFSQNETKKYSAAFLKAVESHLDELEWDASELSSDDIEGYKVEYESIAEDFGVAIPPEQIERFDEVTEKRREEEEAEEDEDRHSEFDRDDYVSSTLTDDEMDSDFKTLLLK